MDGTIWRSRMELSKEAAIAITSLIGAELVIKLI
jgi:hypothetical protein